MKKDRYVESFDFKLAKAKRRAKGKAAPKPVTGKGATIAGRKYRRYLDRQGK